MGEKYYRENICIIYMELFTYYTLLHHNLHNNTSSIIYNKYSIVGSRQHMAWVWEVINKYYYSTIVYYSSICLIIYTIYSYNKIIVPMMLRRAGGII